MENSKLRHTKQDRSMDRSMDKIKQKTENNDQARSEGNTETKYTDTNDKTRNR